MNVFVTGTDTDAGKTTVSAWICSKVQTTYWKIVQTGSCSDSDIIRKFAPNTEILPEACRLRAPLSAYDAAKEEHVAIDVCKFRTNRDKIVIEGSGGLLVPIADQFLMIDAIQSTHSQVVLVSRAKMGMINHLLLTISALRSRFIPILGLVICGNLDKNIQATIEHFSHEKILTILPETDNLEQVFKETPLPHSILEALS